MGEFVKDKHFYPVSGLGPFFALVILNFNIWMVIRRRRLMTPRLQNTQSAGKTLLKLKLN
jgi:hypothetical protein